MGKLLGHQIRNHFKYNWFIPVLPVALIIFGIIFSNVNNSIGGNAITLGMMALIFGCVAAAISCLLYTSPSPRDISGSRMPSSA